MKKAKFCIAAVLGLLASSIMLVACNPVNSFSFSYANAEAYTVADRGEIDTPFSELEVDWYNGAVVVEKNDENDFVEFFEITEGEKVTAATTMHYLLDGAVLRIKYAEPGTMSVGRLKKFLYIRIPSAFFLQEIEINSVSASISVDAVEVREAECSSVSGSISIDCSAEKVEADSISGPIRINGNVRSVSADTTSGSVTVICRAMPSELEVDTISGNVLLRLSEGIGFTLSFDTRSGIMVNAFSEKTAVRGDSYIYLDGRCRYEVDTVSGSLTIEELN